MSPSLCDKVILVSRSKRSQLFETQTVLKAFSLSGKIRWRSCDIWGITEKMKGKKRKQGSNNIICLWEEWENTAAPRMNWCPFIHCVPLSLCLSLHKRGKRNSLIQPLRNCKHRYVIKLLHQQQAAFILYNTLKWPSHGKSKAYCALHPMRHIWTTAGCVV